MDYIILGRLEEEIIEYNKDEVEAVKFLEHNQITEFINTHEVTPWFKLIANSALPDYFKQIQSNLKQINNLKLINFCL